MRLAVQRDKAWITLVDPDKAQWTPAGWHKPSVYYTLDNLTKGHKQPARKRAALVDLPWRVVFANTVRVIDDDTLREVEAIEAEIRALAQTKADIIRDRFLTFRLVTGEDIANTAGRSFATKPEAEHTKR